MRKSKTKTPQWKWFKDLSFLTDQFANNSLEDEGFSLENENEPMMHDPPVLTTMEEASSTDESCLIGDLSTMGPREMPSQRSTHFQIEESFPQMNAPSNEYHVQNITDNDANYYFLMSLLPQMSVLPVAKQWLLRLKIHELVVKDVLAHHEDYQMNGNTLVLSD